jgi:CSLREA domain-containing protein
MKVWRRVYLLFFGLIMAQFGLGLHKGSAATIVVTTTDPGVHGDTTCSLQEAIFSANYDDNVAPNPANPTQFVVTGCNKGNGNDTIVLQNGAVYQMTAPTVDPANPLGPTATPLIFSNITINANGALLVGKANGSSVVATPNQNFRAFAVGDATVDLNAIDPGRVVSGTGQLTLNNAYLKNFQTRGGDGASGGGGGLGAGGVIYLKSGELTVVNSTFQGNFAFGGNGTSGSGGGGGGLGGNGGKQVLGNGGGGGGAVGNGADAFNGGLGPIGGDGEDNNLGGGGGGTFTDGAKSAPGVKCGGQGGNEDTGNQGGNGHDASCPGGGGGGGSIAYSSGCEPTLNCPSGGHGGKGSYGGGGGGGGNGAGVARGDDGGDGGFGGGGGGDGGPGYFTNTKGGDGGFGGGGGCGYADNSNDPGHGGAFGGNADPHSGGGGAGLGGAIFNDSGTLQVFNSTFFGNSAYGGAGVNNGQGQGNAIFSRNGTTNLTHITVSNSSDPNGTGIVDLAIVGDGATANLTLVNNILANNKAGSPNGQLFIANGGSVSQNNNSGNLIETSASTGTINGVAITKNPNLAALTLNQPGNTPTMAIATTSSAYATATGAKALPTDQRGVPRKSLPDIGAYENNDFTQAGPTLVVNTTSDHTPDVCSVVDCTLREAILRANQLNGPNTITFANNVTGTITLGSTLGPLSITDSTTVLGPGARVLAVSGSAGGAVFRVFNITAGVSTVSGLTIRDGTQIGGANTSAGGAGVFNAANTFLTFNDCAFLLNNAHAGDSNTSGGTGATAQGGAILNAGTLTVNRCTFSDNSVTSGRGGDAPGGNGGNVRGGNGGDAQGGAVFNDTSGTLAINDSTFSGNGATAGTGGDGQAFGGNGGTATGAIVNLGTMTVTAATLTSNTGSGGAGGTGTNKFSGGSPGTGNGALSAVSGASTLRNTISANNNGNHGGGIDVNGAFTSGGYNLIGIGDSSTGFGATGDQVGTASAPFDAKLGLLQDNGGLTNTLALLANSPAIDSGKAFGLTTDQRGFLRTAGTASVSGGDGTDIGAFEVQATPTPTPTPTATPTPASGSLGNISTRLQVGTGNNVLFAGFIIQGNASKTVLIRSAGPSLTSFGLSGALSNPQLELHDVNNTIGTNDNWQTTQLGGVIISDQVAAIQNSGAAPLDPAEPAIIATLPAGGYTAIVQGVGGTEGIATVEVYDLSPNNGATLANISTRGFIQTGDNVMIGGFIVVGQSLQVLIRATGPSLIPFGIDNALANPQLELHDANGTLAGNDDWQTTQLGGIIASDQSAAIQNSGLAPGNPAESAIIATLPPGGYTAIAQGVNGGTGVGLVEVFALP